MNVFQHHGESRIYKYADRNTHMINTRQFNIILNNNLFFFLGGGRKIYFAPPVILATALFKPYKCPLYYAQWW